MLMVQFGAQTWEEYLYGRIRVLDREGVCGIKRICMNNNVKDTSMEILNMSAVNQKAKQALLEMNEELRWSSLHCVQLVNVLLNKGEVEAEDDAVQTAKAMMTWRPERIANFLLINAGVQYNPSGWEQAEDYRELAKIILADIEEKMIRHFPWYRSAEE